MRDHHRPVYHFLPPENWMNDPNGLIQHNGVFHVFYQHNPHGPLWGNMSWGHARSTDLVHWEHLPIAIRPDADGPDADGCYSGAIVVHNDVPTMIYTGVRGRNEFACLAYPQDDELIVWRKDAGNPVIRETPTGECVTIFRDHTLWRDDDVWYMGIGSGIEERGGAVMLYSSRDLQSWQYLHPLAIEQPELNTDNALISTGWECPDFFFVDSEPVLLAGEWDGDPISSAWWRGNMADLHFSATSKGFTDYGDSLYAPQTFWAGDGRRLFFGWLRECRSDDDVVAAGWSGALSLPREIVLSGIDHLRFVPAAEVEQLRSDRYDVQLANGELPTSAACEIVAMILPDASVRFAWGDHAALTIASGQATLRANDREMHAALPAAVNGAHELRLFIDHSVLEAYIDGIAISSRVYVDESAWSVARVTASAEIAISVWQIQAIW